MVNGKCKDIFGGFFFVGGRVEKRGNLLGELSIEEYVMGKKISMKGVQDFLALFKKK